MTIRSWSRAAWRIASAGAPTAMTGFTGARIELSQRVLREGVPVAECALTLVCIDRSGRARRIPAELLAAFAGAQHAKLTEGA